MTDDPKFEIIEDYDYPEVAHIEGDGWRVAIKYDEYPDNPRDWTKSLPGPHTLAGNSTALTV